MNHGLLQNATPFTKILFSFVIIIGTFLISSFLVAIIAIPVFDFNLHDLAGILENIDESPDIRIIKYFQICLSVGSFIIPAFIIAYFLGGNSMRFLKLDKKPLPISFLNIALIMIFALPLINILAKWNSQIDLPGFLTGLENWMKEKEEMASGLTDAFLVSRSFSQFLINLLMVAIIPAVGEELLFRGVIQRLFIDWTKNIHIGILISAILFSSFHLQFYGFLPRLLMGILFGYLLVWSGSMWLPVIAHFINNGMAVLVYYIYGKEFVEKDVDTLGTGKEGIMLIVISLILVSFLLWYTYRAECKKMKL